VILVAALLAGGTYLYYAHVTRKEAIQKLAVSAIDKMKKDDVVSLRAAEAKYKEILVYLKGIHAESYMNPIAIGDRDGSIKLNIYDDPSASTTLPVGLFSGTKSVTVPMRSIDSIVASKMCPPPDMIKIDIQGGELAALKGAERTLKNVQFLMLETWIQRGYGKDTPLLGELMAFLSPLGFQPYEFADVFRSENGETVAIDVWFINKAKAKNRNLY
jgi:FkbM family methyltransferase